MPALYTSLRFETAWLEAQQAFPFKAQPMTLCAYDVDCEDILDMTRCNHAGSVFDRADGPWLPLEGLGNPQHQAAVLANRRRFHYVWDRRSDRSQLRVWRDFGGSNHRILAVGRTQAVPGPCDR